MLEFAIIILTHLVWMLIQMVLETKSGLEGAVIGGGHSIAAARLDAQRSVAGWVSEQMGGLSYLFYVRDLVRHSHFPKSFLYTYTACMCFQQHCAMCFAVCAMEDSLLPGTNCFKAHMYIFATLATTGKQALPTPPGDNHLGRQP